MPDVELPDDVVAELEANRKVNAIKLLRARNGIGLKEAKEIVDAYVDERPVSSTRAAPKSDSGIGRIVILVIGVAVIFGLYRYFS